MYYMVKSIKNKVRGYGLWLSLLCAAILFMPFVCRAQEPVTISDPDTWKNSELSTYKGKTIRFTTPFYVTNNYYEGSLTISPRRIYSPTNQALPLSTEYNRLLSANATGTITLTGVSDYHRMGERLLDLTVYVSSTNSVSLQSCTWAGNTRADLEKGYDTEVIDKFGKHTLLVCAMNCEYYLVENTGTDRGPASKTAHQKQRTKISKALSAIAADIYGLVEVERGQSALAEIASDLTTRTGCPYTYIDDGGSAYGSYTKSGYVYRTDKVERYGALYSVEEGVKNRKKIQGFTEISTGERFLFSLNHFKAKSGAGPGANADQGDGQGGYNADRKAEATAVLSYCNLYSRQLGESDVLIMGDLNAYAKEDPITILRNGGMIDLHRTFHADSSYSYTFYGQAGYLDHALCNSSLYPQVTGMVAYHINSDEHDRYTYDHSDDLTMFRCSDHDPVLVGLRLDRTATRDVSFNNYEVFYEGITPCIRNAKGGYYIVFRVDGRVVVQGEITAAEQPIERLTQGLYILNIYGQGTCLSTKLLVP